MSVWTDGNDDRLVRHEIKFVFSNKLVDALLRFLKGNLCKVIADVFLMSPSEIMAQPAFFAISSEEDIAVVAVEPRHRIEKPQEENNAEGEKKKKKKEKETKKEELAEQMGVLCDATLLLQTVSFFTFGALLT